MPEAKKQPRVPGFTVMVVRSRRAMSLHWWQQLRSVSDHAGRLGLVVTSHWRTTLHRKRGQSLGRRRGGRSGERGVRGTGDRGEPHGRHRRAPCRCGGRRRERGDRALVGFNGSPSQGTRIRRWWTFACGGIGCWRATTSRDEPARGTAAEVRVTFCREVKRQLTHATHARNRVGSAVLLRRYTFH